MRNVVTVAEEYNKRGWIGSGKLFSAFWLGASVDSVFISLISDTRIIDPHDINLIFLRCVSIRQLVARTLVRCLGIALPAWSAQPSSLLPGTQFES